LYEAVDAVKQKVDANDDITKQDLDAMAAASADNNWPRAKPKNAERATSKGRRVRRRHNDFDPNMTSKERDRARAKRAREKTANKLTMLEAEVHRLKAQVENQEVGHAAQVEPNIMRPQTQGTSSREEPIVVSPKHASGDGTKGSGCAFPFCTSGLEVPDRCTCSKCNVPLHPGGLCALGCRVNGSTSRPNRICGFCTEDSPWNNIRMTQQLQEALIAARQLVTME
jgi:hypothetical protein